MVVTVLALVAITIAVSLAVPFCEVAVRRVKESQLRNILFTLRVTIHEYSYDHKQAPPTLQ